MCTCLAGTEAWAELKKSYHKKVAVAYRPSRKDFGKCHACEHIPSCIVHCNINDNNTKYSMLDLGSFIDIVVGTVVGVTLPKSTSRLFHLNAIRSSARAPIYSNPNLAPSSVSPIGLRNGNALHIGGSSVNHGGKLATSLHSKMLMPSKPRVEVSTILPNPEPLPLNSPNLHRRSGWVGGVNAESSATFPVALGRYFCLPLWPASKINLLVRLFLEKAFAGKPQQSRNCPKTLHLPALGFFWG